MKMNYSYNVDPHDLVMEFHTVYDMPIHLGYPKTLKDERLELRLGLIEEEWHELNEACEQNKITDIADALGDMVYVIYGMAIEMGLNLAAVLEEIHASNLSKLDENSDPIYREDGKVLKGPYFREPDLKSVIFSE